MIKISSFQAKAQFRRRFFLFSLLLSGIGFLFYGVPELLAQTAPDVLAEGEDEGPATMFDNVKQAGLWMVPLVIASIAMVALIVYNFIQLTTAKFKPEDLKMALLDHMANCRVRSAIEVSSTSPTYLGRMMASALPQVDATDPDTLGREDVEDAAVGIEALGGSRTMKRVEIDLESY